MTDLSDRQELVRGATRLAQALADEVGGRSAALIATADGFELAAAGARSISADRLAAMVSSFAALGDAAGRETGIGNTNCLVIDATDGRLVCRCVQHRGEQLIVVLLTDKTVLLGMSINTLNSAERLLENA